MSKFIIQVNGSVYGSSASFRALAFCQSVLANGHDIITVFFYQDGVTNSNALTCPASDEIDMHAKWQTFAQQHNVPLTNCVSAALRRGVLSQQEAEENGKSHWNSSDHFSMGGLGELVVGIEKADRLVSF
ncbi:sulfurtransferase complex subunit TusD [Shewanella litoralis]|uniref:Sulfurtransferase TusD n=1 Tax=Shewanella litoralis TaxID=2282700 RepID=A0ABQ2R7Z4_9GAMM|nr:sulfurtransferase complex subunit TusD [Shewanella litoralis]GGQ12240.1 sulfurtransferase TusD [Shewanella litoralis]